MTSRAPRTESLRLHGRVVAHSPRYINNKARVFCKRSQRPLYLHVTPLGRDGREGGRAQGLGGARAASSSALFSRSRWYLKQHRQSVSRAAPAPHDPVHTVGANILYRPVKCAQAINSVVSKTVFTSSTSPSPTFHYQSASRRSDAQPPHNLPHIQNTVTTSVQSLSQRC